MSADDKTWCEGKILATDIVFFDAIGHAWVTCAGDHLDATAFGPTSIARRLTTREAWQLGLSPYLDVLPDGTPTHWEAARTAGLLLPSEEEGGWDTLPGAAKRLIESAFNDEYYDAIRATWGWWPERPDNRPWPRWDRIWPKTQKRRS